MHTTRHPAAHRSTISLCAAALVAMLAPHAHAQSQVVGWGYQVAWGGREQPASLIAFTAVAGGRDHSVGLLRDGSVSCWGSNVSNQSAVPGDLSTVVQVAAGGYHSVALQADGRVRCWGLNAYSQCDVPSTLSEVSRVSAGDFHTIAVRGNGALTCWGDDRESQSTPPAGLPPIRQAAGGSYHTVAVATNGLVSCWGGNYVGQCDVPANLPRIKQVEAGEEFTVALSEAGQVFAWGVNFLGECEVPGSLPPVAEVVAGSDFTVARLTTGALVAWGGNAHGQIDVPAGVAGVALIAAGQEHALARLSDGSLVCWGGNRYGQCNPPSALRDIVQVAAGVQHSVGIRVDGSVTCWGSNLSGQCDAPLGLQKVVQVAGGGMHTVAMTDGGSLACWGDNAFGQCDLPASNVGFTQIAAGYGHTLALRQGDTLYAWGLDDVGQCQVPDNAGQFTQVAAGGFHSAACRSNGSVACWGWNSDGQSSPPALTNAVQVSAGDYHTVALRANGEVTGWGYGGAFEAPSETSLLAVAVAAGSVHTLVLFNDGTVQCWGQNTDQQCSPPSPPEGVTQIAAGGNHSLALLAPSIASCDTTGGTGVATVRISGSSWQSVGVWQWKTAGPQVPGVQSEVDLGAYGSVGSECSASAGTFLSHPGSSLLVPADLTASDAVDTSIHVNGEAVLAGRLWLLGRGAMELPEDLDLPVLSAATVTGSFDLIQTDVPAPAGKFLTLVPSEVNGRTVFSLRLLDLPGNAELTGASAGNFSGSAVAAATIDINHDGFDDLALAIDYGANQNGLIQILLNDGSGNLGGSSVLRSIPPQPTCMAVGGVNDDSKLDVVVGIGSDNTARVYLDNGASALVAGSVISGLGATPTAVIVLDGNGASAMPTSNPIGVGTSGGKLKIYADSTLQQEVTMAGTPSTVSGGDTKGTGGTTIVTGGTTSATLNVLPPAQTGFVQTLVRDANGQWAIQQTFGLTAKPVAMDVADIDGDGLADIVTANADPVLPAPGSALPVLSIFRNANGSFQGGTPYQPDNASSGLSVTLVDVDNDGDRDIVSVHRKVGTSEAALLRIDTLGAGTPLSVGQTTVLDASDPIIATRGDLDGTGGEDVYLVNQPSSQQLVGTRSVKPFLAAGGGLFGDLDGSGSVDSGDIALALLDFGSCPGCAADLDQSGVVDFGDVALILLSYG